MDRLGDKDKKGVLIIICCGLIFFSLGILSIYLSRERVDSDTLCLLNEPITGHTAILIDRTDPLNSKQTRWLKKEIIRIKVDLKTNEKLSIFLITNASDSFLRPIFSLCSPGSGKDANPLYENPKRIRKKFEAKFGKPLETALDPLTKGTSYQESAIFETIKNLTDESDFSQKINNRKIIIVSDMLQNVAAFSHYKNKTFRDLVGTEYYQKIKPNLNSVSMKIYYMANNYPNARMLQGPKHIKFWKTFFKSAGADQIELDKIGYLSLREEPKRGINNSKAPSLPKNKSPSKTVKDTKPTKPTKANASNPNIGSNKETSRQPQNFSSFKSSLRDETAPLSESNTKSDELLKQLESIKKESVQNKYVGEITAKVKENWKDPVGGGTGLVQVSFSVFPMGNIATPKIRKSSGDRKLDDLALRAIKNATPFPPFPKEIKKTHLTFIIQFSYVPEKG